MKISLTIILAVVLCSPVFADPAIEVSLAELVNNNGSIVSGDKLFNEFTYSATGDMPPAESVNIKSYTDPDGNYGIVIQGAFVDHFTTLNGSDAAISYRVTVLDQNMLISDAHLVGNPSAIGDAAMQVYETFLFDESDKNMSIHSISPGHQFDLSVDSVYFDNLYRTLTVEKDIVALVLSEGSFASISLIYQSFSQVSIPEPSVLVFLMSGLALLCCRARCCGR